MRTLKRTCLRLLSLIVVGMMASSAQSQESPEILQPSEKPAYEAVIGPEDSITIVALDCEEVSKTWRVSSSGDLSLPLVGTIRVTGLSSEQLKDILIQRLKKFLIAPQVTVFVSELRSKPVMVGGAVEKPGLYQVEGEHTLFEVLLLAGGPKNAGPTLNIKRNADAGPIPLAGVKQTRDSSATTIELNLQEVMSGRGDQARLAVIAHDIITVSPLPPQRFVHISGEVNRPGAVELISQDAVSLMKVLAVAGGTTPIANPGETMIMHINPDGIQTATSFVNLNQIMNGKARDLELTAGDVVIVPTSQMKAILRASGATAVNSGIFTVFNILARY